MEEGPSWKNLKLSLERPYKDDNGEPIPVLLDITPEGQHVFEPVSDPVQTLGRNLARIFVERGFDFFEKTHGRPLNKLTLDELKQQTQEEGVHDLSGQTTEDPESSTRPMTTEELYKMRMQVLPQLHISLGEMSHAQELLVLLLSSTSPGAPSSNPSLPPSTLTASIVSQPPPILSVQAFDAQLSVGGKDELLRKAANIFKSASQSMDRGRLRNETYWTNALKIRRANWGLLPAPLPLGSATGKGADKTSKDFLVSFGLEESPQVFRRRAVGHLSTYETESSALVFPSRQRTRLLVGLEITDQNGARRQVYNHIQRKESQALESSLQDAQQEIVEQEIFSLLIKEAGDLPTASARVSERLIVIEAAQSTELRFELAESSAVLPVSPGNHVEEATRRLPTSNTSSAPGITIPTSAPSILQPVIDLVQYRVFCETIKGVIDKVTSALFAAGVSCTLRYDPIAQSGVQLLEVLGDIAVVSIGGEASLRIDKRHTLRFTLLSPSSLSAHLPQATVPISSVPQLTQLLHDEVEHCLLSRICQEGQTLSEQVNGTWFLDEVASCSIGRWEGCVINFRITYGPESSLCCSAFHTNGLLNKKSTLESYSATTQEPLLSWVKEIIEKALTSH